MIREMSDDRELLQRHPLDTETKTVLEVLLDIRYLLRALIELEAERGE